MPKISLRRYNKLLTVREKLYSLRDDFADDKDISLPYSKISVRFQLNIALLVIDSILQEC